MRTKTLILAAAALAAGLASSVAQSNVYSINIVGYYNVTLPANTKVLCANQLDDGTNQANDLLGGLANGSSVQYWNGSAFVASSKSAGAYAGNPSLPPGSGFFVTSKALYTNTFIGTAPMSNSLAMTANVKVLVGSRIPFSGNANDPIGSNSLNLASLPNGSAIQYWNGTSFVASSKAAGAFAGNPAIAVGQGFFLTDKTTSAWNQWIYGY
jgi:hypothetical protein